MRKRLALIGAGAGLLVLAGGAIASASIPDSSGVIHACYQSPPPVHGANLQIIDTGAGGSCGGGMVPLTWNQTGPQGPVGATGANGPQGPAGATGATGPQGPAGPGTAFDFGVLNMVQNPSGPFTCTLSQLGGPDAATMTVVPQSGNSGCILQSVSVGDSGPGPVDLFTQTVHSSIDTYTIANQGGGNIFVMANESTTFSFVILP